MAMVEDADIRNYRPTFVMDRDGIRRYPPAPLLAGITAPAAEPAPAAPDWDLASTTPGDVLRYLRAAGSDWHLDQAVSRDQALAMFTTAAAFATFSEAERGKIAVGQRADLSAFSADLMTAPPADIAAAHAVLTVSEGRITHEAP